MLADDINLFRKNKEEVEKKLERRGMEDSQSETVHLCIKLVIECMCKM